jgi:hypothetical protein
MDAELNISNGKDALEENDEKDDLGEIAKEQESQKWSAVRRYE